MASIEELKKQIDLNDLADRLGWNRHKESGNYHSPNRDDKKPSVSIFSDGKMFKDHSTGESGSCIDMVLYDTTQGLHEVKEAVDKLHDLYSLPCTPQQHRAPEKKSLIDHIFEKCFDVANLERAINYLTTERGIDESTIQHAIKCKTVGFNDYTSPKKNAGEYGYGGPAVAFPVLTLNPGRLMGLDMRYLDPSLNGGVKTQFQGTKTSPWIMDRHRFKRAHTVHLVESPINALSIDSCGTPGVVGVAFMGVGNVDNIDYHFLLGKRVIITCDNDEPDEKTNIPPGSLAAWKLYENLTSLNISTHMLDQSEWAYNDVNDILKNEGKSELNMMLKRLDPYIIPGVHGNMDQQKGKRRVYLPLHDCFQYWRYRAKEDFVTFVEEWAQDEEDTEKKVEKKFKDVCGFRIAGITRVSIASATSTMTGESDSQPRVLFSVSVQTPRHGNKLIRKVFEDDRLHNVDQWKKFGPVFAPTQFQRMVNILERSADLGARDAVNFVGLAWRDGRLIVNEGADCYFTEPDKQCPYHNLAFPSGNINDARIVIEEYQKTFLTNAAAIPLVWVLGAHLKVLLGFWPHLTIQAEKGAGKSTLIKRLERTLAFTMFSNESLKTAFRILTSLSYTSHPVGWEEISANNIKVIDEAVSMLQQSYQYVPTKRGSDMTDYLICAPVMLAGEDVPVKSLIGKLIRTDLCGAKKGPTLPQSLPKFPLRQWLQYLATQTRDDVMDRHQAAVEYCRKHCRTKDKDSGASRMVENYAAVLVSWGLLCEFAGIDKHQGNFIGDLVTEMNQHIAETSGDREPWVWLMEMILHEITTGHYRSKYAWTTIADSETGEPVDVLAIRTSDAMNHIKTEARLKAIYDGSPVKSDRIFKKQLKSAGVLASDDFEKTIGGTRVAHLVGISLKAIDAYGLHPSPPENIDGRVC